MTVVIYRERGYLPHLELQDRSYFVTFRLADSVPAELLEAWKYEREDVRKKAQEQNRKLSKYEAERLKYLYSERVEKYLDSGAGDCWLKNPEIGRMVLDALKYFDGDRYDLHSWSVMPNHVHVLFTPKSQLGGSKIDSLLIPILHSWKSFTSTRANRILGRQGRFWQEEYYDSLVRSDRQFAFYVHYILENPVKAGLCKQWQEWPWSGCSDEIRSWLSEIEAGGQDARAPSPERRDLS